MAFYISRTDLENAVGANTIAAIFDDNMDGQPESAAIDACCESASVEVDAILVNEYDIPLPLTNPPPVVKYAALDFGLAYAMRRRPDIVRALNEKSWTDFRDAAMTKLKMFASSFERLPEAVAIPANVGGSVVSNGPRLTIDSTDGQSNQGDF